MYRRSPGAVILTLCILFFGWMFIWNLSPRPSPSTTPSQSIQIVASFYPLAEFSKQVGGNRVIVTNITPAGVEPHDFEPTPRELVTAHEAQLFVYNGGVDAWAEQVAPSLEDEGVVTIGMSKELHAADPHVWLDPVLAQEEVKLIRDALIAVDAEGTSVYQANADTYLAKLAALDQRFKDGLASCELHTIITSHSAFGYMATRYGFTQLSVTGLSPDEEPSPRTLADLAATAKTTGVKYIFFETLVSPALAQTLANEIGAQTLAFNPLEGLTDEELALGEDYISVMNQNLAALKTAMVCTTNR